MALWNNSFTNRGRSNAANNTGWNNQAPAQQGMWQMRGFGTQTGQNQNNQVRQGRTNQNQNMGQRQLQQNMQGQQMQQNQTRAPQQMQNQGMQGQQMPQNQMGQGQFHPQGQTQYPQNMQGQQGIGSQQPQNQMGQGQFPPGMMPPQGQPQAQHPQNMQGQQSIGAQQPQNQMGQGQFPPDMMPPQGQPQAQHPQNMQGQQGMGPQQPQNQMGQSQFFPGMMPPQGQPQAQYPQNMQGQQGMGPPQQQMAPQMNQQQGSSPSPVNFEPVDEKTLAEVRKIVEQKMIAEGIPIPDEPPKAPQVAEQTSPQLPQVFYPPMPEMTTQLREANPREANITDTLREFIQGERNSNLFYSNLSALSKDAQTASALKLIVDECNRRKLTFNTIYDDMTGTPYEARQTEIAQPKRIKDGVEMAINVESKSLREISDFYERLDNDNHLKKVNAIIHKKFCDLSSLQNLLRQI